MELILTIVKDVPFSTWLLLGMTLVRPISQEALENIALIDKPLSR